MKKPSHHQLLLLIPLITLVVSLTACSHKHTYGAWEAEKAPSCTETGTEVRYCECKEKETKTIPATGHTPGKWATDTHATCTQDGSQHLACTICSATIQTEAIPATGHTPGKWVVDVSATCTQNGNQHQVCSVCNTTLKTESVPATGVHTYSEEITVEASCAGDGTKTFTCSVCKDSYSESIVYKSYSATEIYDNHVNMVGEIITYDKNGKEYALGTCFVYSSDGKMITNYHVIEDAYSAKIALGGIIYPVQYVLAYDKDIDIAVLQISASNLTPVKLCERVHKVGETVYAIGSSKGLTATFSDGMITYSNRSINGVSYTQHDAPISSGNSGGPLINRYGEVIGINTWTVLESQNLNFAINISELHKLTYGSPLTMAAFYQKECNVYNKLKNYIIENGTYYSSDDCYTMVCDIAYTKDNNTKYTILAYYYTSDGTITLDMLIDDGAYWTYFEIDESVSGIYYWAYFDENDYEMSGTLYATSYNSNSLLGYDYTNINYTSTKNSTRELASSMMSYLCSKIDSLFADVGITAKDLHFYNY